MEDPATRDQVTSKEILDVAFEKSKSAFTTPRQTIQDIEELNSYQQTKRREYEQHIHKNRLNLKQWIRYAKWEVENNHDFARARSIFERALDVNVQHIPFWVQYIELELSHKNVNHARNLLDRAVKTLPRVNKLWFLYVLTEEMLKDYQMVRSVFENWLAWHPDASAWDAYISFEARYEEVSRVRSIFRRYLSEFPQGYTWYKWIDYEMENNGQDIATIRAVFESAVDTLLAENPDDEKFFDLVVRWADWEAGAVNETERALEIYKVLLGGKVQIPASLRNRLQTAFKEFKSSIREDGKSSEIAEQLKKLAKYRNAIKENPYDYDSWWSYITALESNGVKSTDELRTAFDTVVANNPKDNYKSVEWRRYAMFWIRYALWEEFANGEIESARQVWNNCLKAIPHKQFSFAKVWIGYAEFELRNNVSDGLTKSRKILGRAIGQTSTVQPKTKLFQYYIDFEKKLGEWERVRQLFQKWLETAIATDTPAEHVVEKYLEFESSIGEYDRCDLILSVVNNLADDAQAGESLDRGRLFGISVEFYKDEMKYDKVRELFRQLLDKEPTADNWISLALLESSIPSAKQLEEFLVANSEEFEVTVDEEQIAKTREVFTEADAFFRKTKDNESRLAIVEAWKEYEEINGNDDSLAVVVAKLPTKVKKRRTVDFIEEEYMEYVSPDEKVDEAPKGVNKFLASAKKWAATAATAET
ncbi:Pre-mRNA-splicing factor CLF1 [Candida viswanathii]|uniref:Pre-mRNA-splicing factor CLF1 n=1 Tax=Candida viswanathii TaxID=5486 RepID=A0A367Y9G3_9ASCO|nr:Pre-mRNA-splicing factor CLF1 [Candida viswanathii]